MIAVGFLILQSAFQAGDLRAALPLLEVSEPVVAGVLGLALMHERLHAIDGPTKAVVAASVVLMALSAAMLARATAQGRGEPTPGPPAQGPAARRGSDPEAVGPDVDRGPGCRR